MLKELEVNIPIDNEKVTFSSKDLYFDETTINTHMSELSNNLAYWGALKNNFERLQGELELEFKVWLAQHKVAVDNPQGRYKSETAKEEAVIVQHVTDYMTRQKRLADVGHQVNVLSTIVDAFKCKKDMLISLGAMYRSEMMSGISIKEKIDGVNRVLSEKL